MGDLIVKKRVENIVGLGKGGSVLVHIGTNNVEREGITATGNTGSCSEH